MKGISIKGSIFFPRRQQRHSTCWPAAIPMKRPLGNYNVGKKKRQGVSSTQQIFFLPFPILFERIIIAGANNGILPLSNAVNAASHDLAEKKEAEQRERALLYVAATRAKKEVLVTWFGRKSKYL